MDALFISKWTNFISIIKGGLIEKIKRMYDTYFYFDTPFMHYSKGKFPKRIVQIRNLCVKGWVIVL
jgi:hypothetical protein